MPDSDQVFVIGGGIAGLGAAHYLARQGLKPVLLEAGRNLGGRAGWVEREGLCLEVGGKNFSSGWPNFNALLAEFGIKGFDHQHPNFHIVLDGKLVRLEKQRTLAGDWSILRRLGLRGAWQFRRFLEEARRNAPRLDHAGGLIEAIEARYDAAPMAARFDRRLAYGPFRMFSIIMGAAEPDEMYASQLMLFVSGFGKGSHHALAGGIRRLFAALGRGKAIHHAHRVRRIHLDGDKVAGLSIETPAGLERVPAARVISAVPLPVLMSLVEMPPEVEATARQVRYFPLALINAVYDGDVFDEQVNSIMFDENSVLGHCSANRMYQRHIVRFTLSGRRARAVLDQPDEELIALAEREFQAHHPIRVPRRFFHVQRHRGGICAYAPHFSQVRRRLLGWVAGIDGLEVAGDWLEGHSMEGCLTSARHAAERLLIPDIRRAAA